MRGSTEQEQSTASISVLVQLVPHPNDDNSDNDVRTLARVSSKL